jgi:AraC family transcriptional regulator
MLMLRSKTEALLRSELPDGHSIAHPIAHSHLSRVLERMDAHLQEPIVVSELAETAGLSMFHFSRTFHQSMGTSPYQYLLARKIERAKLLLADSNKSIAEVATIVGFTRQNHFARVFREYTSLSPNEFRRRL